MARNEEPGMPGKRNGTSGSNKWSKYGAKTAPKVVTWVEIETAALLSALVAITDQGGALLLGKTRDGGSFAITVCMGDDRGRFFASTPEECMEHLAFIEDHATD